MIKFFLEKYIIVCIMITVSACSDIEIQAYDIDRANMIINSVEGESTSILFFTDPHINGYDDKFEYYLKLIKDSYNSLPLEYVICGGDWLTAGDTILQAKEKLSFIDNYLYGLFNEYYYPILGNHDTNYQGRATEQAAPNTGTMSHEEIVELMFAKQGNSYYSFNSKASRFFVFDTGLDWYPAMDNLKWDQIDWFIEELKINNADNNVILMHIYTNDFKTPLPFTEYIMSIAEAYNDKRTVIFNGTEYDFSNSLGTISCVLCGHNHCDFVDRTYSIPVIGTINLRSGDVPSYDICIFNWETNILNLVRVGNGADREVLMAF